MVFSRVTQIYFLIQKIGFFLGFFFLIICDCTRLFKSSNLARVARDNGNCLSIEEGENKNLTNESAEYNSFWLIICFSDPLMRIFFVEGETFIISC